MNSDSLLGRLANACGIEAGYHDIWGNWHALSEATARRLLAAMGVAVDDDAAIEAALSERYQAEWRALLPPVCVRRIDDAVWLPLVLAASEQEVSVDWCLREENGSVHQGTMMPIDLELLDEVELDGQRLQRRRFVPAWTPTTGYHQLSVSCASDTADARLIVTPARCRQPLSEDTAARAWGAMLQLYGVRSARNWGIGDLGDLARAATLLGELGADLIGINPLHALYPDEPDRASPYSPSSRQFANPLYLDVEAIAEFDECAAARARVSNPAFQDELARLRALELVDYDGVAQLKWPILRALFEHFRSVHCGSAPSPRGQAFRDFQAKGDRALRLQALFEVLHAHLGNTTWPEEYLHPDGPAVMDFASKHADEIEFHEYLQWLIQQQLDHAQACARAAGMRIGLYRDLAVGSDAFGADVWAAPQAFAHDVSAGAPPDDFNLQGQAWGLPPWLPDYLRHTAYADFIAMLRANMPANGALRIDHVIGLMRMFWVPREGTAADGAFVHYPLRDLLGILALESERTGCVIIGEDLGTVPDELRAALYEYGLLSYYVLYFSKHWHGDHSFLSPADFPRQALVTVSTHDLPTLCGYWRGHDLALRDFLHMFPGDDMRSRLIEERERDRDRLLQALESQGLRPGQVTDPDTARPTADMIAAVHRYIARSEAALMTVQMEDVFGQLEQANVPGTVHDQPNWRRRLDVPLEQWEQHAELHALAAHLRRERQR